FGHLFGSRREIIEEGGFDNAHAVARAYDRAAIKFRGVDADINFNISDYEENLKHMKNLTKEEFVHILRLQINGFAHESLGIESFSKLGDSIYFEETESIPGLYIIQFIPSAFDWKSGSIMITQKIKPINSWEPTLHVTLSILLKEIFSSSPVKE
ncbi:uncharacterized protein A4U43_C03F14770, partial [Asparagus officinalis]